MKKGVLLVNFGSPDSPSVKDVRKYLSQFLNDPFVMDIHSIVRFFLVNFFIVPFRASKSAKKYEHIWTSDGSPLIVHGKKVKNILQKELNRFVSNHSSKEESEYIVELGMRYQNPSIEFALQNLKKENVNEITVLPLYPQYALSSTESTIKEVKRVIKKINLSCEIKFIRKFFDHPDFIDAWIDVSKKYNCEEYDYFIFSYHGLPERQIFKACEKEQSDNSKNFKSCLSIYDCENRNLNPETRNSFCYRAACYETTRQLVKRLNISKKKYITSFQSRFNGKWLAPYTDKIIKEKAKEGVKKILVFSPSFVADCLETIYEIDFEYSELFKKHGEKKLQLVKSLNENAKWIECLINLIKGGSKN
ncbi:MAG: ferrochelatase [Bacteroidota bacterium]